MNLRYLNTTIKMSIAFIVAIIIARLIGLTYDLTAGILAVLSIQLTRKDSMLIAFKRLINSVIAILLSSLIFVTFGYQLVSFFIFATIFIGISYFVKLSYGIVPSLVLVSHLYVYGRFSGLFLLETFVLIITAIIVALGLNLIYPHYSRKELLSYMKDIDIMLSDHIMMLSFLIKNLQEPKDFLVHYKKLKIEVEALIEKAKLVDKDILFDEKRVFINYIFMREAQFQHIYRIYELSLKIHSYHSNIELLYQFIYNLSFSIGKFNMAIDQMSKLDFTLNTVKKQALPQNREEFETRAILFMMIQELNAFLELKIKFHKDFPDFDLFLNDGAKK
jgi:uncharacterized membrane protein YgaE (UPF0421/DUF939 family)